MLNVTEQAGQAIKNFLADQNIQGEDVLRVFIASGCGGGGALRIGLDTPNEADNVYELSGLKYAVEKELDDELGEIFVDLVSEDGQEFFHITTTNPVPFQMDCGGCSGCG